ncbi:hypothetical protein SLS60_005754 [Paraconiothyrium brasiliense]|uniref:Uncharacterized protein n=1 Tax=Paraconiothyrium brasiliense TaxID=300254 RepID=A0ABR3RDN4_9PLEO
MSTQSLLDSVTNSLSVYDKMSIDQNLRLPISKWSDKPTPTFLVQVLRDTRNNAILVFTAVGERLGLDVRYLSRIIEDRWTPHFPLSRMASVAITTALPGAFLAFIRRHPTSWAARHQTKIANALHVFALVTVANQRLSIQDLLVAALVVVSFEALQRVMHESETPPAVETLSSQTYGAGAQSDMSGSPRPVNLTRKHSASNPESLSLSSGSKDAEIDRMHKRLAESRMTEKARDIDLKRTKADLNNARATLTETFAEYASLRDELKTMKQTLGRDHQAVIYRKDIELFALRKANEQKENYIKEREVKLDDIYRQHKAALERKDTELRNVKERMLFLERQTSPKFQTDDKVDSATESDSQGALQIKFLRVKGRNSTEVDDQTLDEKDDEIAKLKTELAGAVAAGDALSNAQIELRRAWDATSEVQQALNDERRQHVQNQEKLREAALQIEELTNNAQRPSPTRLDTIEEQNAQELEAMFNTAQQDNSRLYGEVEALEKRVREANARVFMSEQAAEALCEQLRLEKAINDDMETARPSLVHRVHFQRMEGQLKESREKLEDRDEEIKKLQTAATERDAKIEEIRKANEASSSAQTKIQEENERLKQNIKDLESTKEQLMLDHERLARHRARNRTTSAEHTSARSSSATLIHEPPQPPAVTAPAEEEPPLPARPVSVAPTTPTSSSIQGTPERHLRRDPPPNRLSMISNDVPPVELRHSRRKSLTLKGLMRKIVRKDEDEVADKTAVETPRPKTALTPKDKNALLRPKTAAPDSTAGKKPKEEDRPKTAAPAKEDSGHRRFYSEGRPNTAVTGIRKGEGEVREEVGRPKSRGWGAS